MGYLPYQLVSRISAINRMVMFHFYHSIFYTRFRTLPSKNSRALEKRWKRNLEHHYETTVFQSSSTPETNLPLQGSNISPYQTLLLKIFRTSRLVGCVVASWRVRVYSPEKIRLLNFQVQAPVAVRPSSFRRNAQSGHSASSSRRGFRKWDRANLSERDELDSF